MSPWSNSTALFGCLLAAMLVVPVGAQDAPPASMTDAGAGTISGRVIDAGTRRPISDVIIRVDGSVHETLSDRAGMFTLEGIPEGEQRLVLEHLSYGEHARRVLVNAGENLSLEARISTRAIELAPLVVEALSELERRRITGGVPIREVTRDDLNLAQSTGRNLAQMLRERIPGTSVRPGRFGMSCVEYRGARGGSGPCRDLTVFVDGVRIADPGTFYDLVPPDDIERMEILSVAEAGARYGSLAGNGVLLIETRRPPRPETPDGATVQNSLFDWSGEPQPYAWKRVFATSFAANAIGVGISLALADQCLWRAESGS
ncbi:MAG: TonB-dependent receptor plug domain-containing protein, partial [Thioalkalivibrio sp.]|nr:TonB-dependent receptor plug domain-containing protein [Thioalkalivibrio sp.]